MPTLSAIVGPEPYATDVTEFAWTASTPGGDEFVLTGREILLIRNSHGSNAYDVTIQSEPDAYGREADITHELAAGEFAIFGPIPIHGFADEERKLQLTSENAAILYAIIRLHSGN